MPPPAASPVSTMPLQRFCRTARGHLLSDHSKIFVLGNLSADLDSICSAIGFACLQDLKWSKNRVLQTRETDGGTAQPSERNSPAFIPVVNARREKFPTLIQQEWWLEKFGISQEDLVFWDDVVGPATEQPATSYWFLVDHCDPAPAQRELIMGKVIGVLDHHEVSEAARDGSLYAEPPDGSAGGAEKTDFTVLETLADMRIIYAPSAGTPLGAGGELVGTPLVGSCTSLVLEQTKDVLLEEEEEATAAREARNLLLGGLLADTRYAVTK